VLGELHWFIHHKETTTEDEEKTSEVLAYLEACHYLSMAFSAMNGSEVSIQRY